jgi:ABC-2 type transport system ATP-binding protein
MRSRTSSSPVVALEGLTKRYGGSTVVDDVTLHVERGEIFGILGTNGAGKTTSVECAQGLRRPDAGSVRVLGLDPIADRSSLAGRVGSQLQDSNLPERLRVEEAVWLFAESETSAARVMDEWDLLSIRRTPFGALSGGQRQRLLLALALLNDPEVVFLDELTQGLDPDARRSVWGLIEQVRDTGATVVLVTHFTEEAEALCDRVAVMRGGRVIAEGTPDQLIEHFSGGVRLRFAGGTQELAWARCVPGAQSVRQSGEDIELTGPPTLVATVGHALVEHGHSATPLRVHQPDLEEALLTIINTKEVAA